MRVRSILFLFIVHLVSIEGAHAQRATAIREDTPYGRAPMQSTSPAARMPSSQGGAVRAQPSRNHAPRIAYPMVPTVGGQGAHAAPSRSRTYSGAANRASSELEGMSFDGPTIGKSIRAATPRELRDTPVVKEILEVQRAYEGAKQSIEEIEQILSDPRQALRDTLRDITKESLLLTLRAGLALAIGKTFGGDQSHTEEVRELSKIAANVITTMPSFSGVVDRIQELRDAPRQFVEGKMDQLFTDIKRFGSVQD